MPLIPRTPSVVPTKQYPWMKRLMTEVDYACPSCSSGANQPVFHTLGESILEPISGPAVEGKGVVTEKGIIATRFLVMCPETRCVPENSPLMMGGIVDLMAIDPNYKRPFRPVTDEGSISFDGDDQAEPAVRTPDAPKKFGSGKLKKTSDLNPKTRKLTAKEKRLIKAAEDSNKAPVPKDALQPGQRK